MGTLYITGDYIGFLGQSTGSKEIVAFSNVTEVQLEAHEKKSAKTAINVVTKTSSFAFSSMADPTSIYGLLKEILSMTKTREALRLNNEGRRMSTNNPEDSLYRAFLLLFFL